MRHLLLALPTTIATFAFATFALAGCAAGLDEPEAAEETVDLRRDGLEHDSLTVERPVAEADGPRTRPDQASVWLETGIEVAGPLQHFEEKRKRSSSAASLAAAGPEDRRATRDDEP